MPSTVSNPNRPLGEEVVIQGDKEYHESPSASLHLYRKVPVPRDPHETFERPDEEYFPEGGRAAWLALTGCFCAWMSAFGLMNTVGTFQAYLQTHELSLYSEAQVGWIFGLYLFMSYCCGVQAGPIFDAFGPRSLTAAGSVSIVASMFLLGACYSEYTLEF